jgi:predicted nucleic acid-binding protein
VDDLAAALC